MYLTYQEYVELGGNVTESAFPLLERKSERMVDYYTQDRIKSLELIPQSVKELMVEYVNIYSQNTDGEKVASFSNDGVSVTFDNSKSDEQVMYDLAVEYLPMDLLYCGVM